MGSCCPVICREFAYGVRRRAADSTRHHEAAQDGRGRYSFTTIGQQRCGAESRRVLPMTFFSGQQWSNRVNVGARLVVNGGDILGRLSVSAFPPSRRGRSAPGASGACVEGTRPHVAGRRRAGARQDALIDAETVARCRSKIRVVTGSERWWWSAALSGWRYATGDDGADLVAAVGLSHDGVQLPL